MVDKKREGNFAYLGAAGGGGGWHVGVATHAAMAAVGGGGQLGAASRSFEGEHRSSAWRGLGQGGLPGECLGKIEWN